MTEQNYPVYGEITGPIVMIGFGSIGRGTLPLIERHFAYDKKRFVVIDPEDKDRKLLDSRGIRFIHQAVTKDNFRHLLTPLLTAGGGQGFCVNVSVDTSSLDIMKKVCATGAGSASPVVSTMMASNLPFRRIKPSMMRTRSPRTVQQMQPLFISNTSSSALTTSSLSMPISPNSLTITANFLPCGSDKMRLSSVVFPAPR